MKRMITCCVLVLVLCGCSSENKKPENPLRIKRASYITVDLNEINETNYTYDDLGLLVKEESFTDGNWNCVCTYEYDQWGNIILQKWDYDDGTTCVREYILTIDANSHIVKRQTYENGEIKAIEEMEYDRQGNLVTSIGKNYIGEGYKIVERKMKYDSYGNLLESVVKWSNDPSMGGTTTYQYEKDQLIREECYAAAGWLKSYIVYSYDESGLTQTAMEYNKNDSLQSKTITTYDKYGNILKQEYYSHTGKISGSGDEIADRILTCTYEKLGTGK